MLLKSIFFAALALLGAGALFKLYQGGDLRAWLQGPPAPKAFVFDNGSVRDTVVPASAPVGKAVVLSPPGALRKCVRGDRVSYSNLTCPEGFREKPVATEGLSVLPAAPTPARTAPADRASALREGQEPRPDDKLRQKMIDRAVEAEGR